MRGRGWQSVHDPEVLPEVLARWERSLAAAEPLDMVFPLRGADGVFRPFLTRVVPMRDQAGKPVRWFGTNTDISEQRRTEEELRQSVERFRALATATSDVVYRMSPDWSEMRQLRGQGFMTDTETSNRAWLQEYIHPDDQAHVMAAIREAVRTGSIFELEHRVRTMDGSLGWTLSRAVPIQDAQGNLVEWFGAASNITRRKLAEDALRESEQRVRRRLNSILSPDVTIGEIEISDIIDAEAVRSLLSEFYELVRVPIGLIDRQGQVVVDVGWQEICTRFHRAHPDTNQNCLESNTCLARDVASGEPRLNVCKNNLCDLATPFAVSDRLLGRFVASQFLLDDEPVDRELFSAQARRHGFDEKEYLAALDAVPRINRRTAQTVISFLHKFGEVVGQLSYANIKLAKSIAALQRAQDEVRSASEQRGLALDAANLGCWDYRFQTGEVFWDERCRNLWGVEAGGQLDYDETIARIHADDRAAIDDAMARAIGGAKDGAYHGEFRVVWPDGSVHWVAAHGRVFFEGEGTARRAIRFLGVNTDIGERKQAEQAILDLNATLERRVEERTLEWREANRELESFSYSVSHDLRAPLRGVAGFAKILLRDYPGKILDETALDYLNRMSAAAQRMGQLIADLLALSRLNRHEIVRQRVNLSKLAQIILAEYRSNDPARQVEVEIEPGLAALADPRLARVVLENLLGNAWKYSSKNEAAAIAFGAMRNQNEPAFFVRDNGVGFDMAHADQLFAPFQRLHRTAEFEGNGIGLATVQRVIRRHGGRVWVEAKPGEGATFYFTWGEPNGTS